MSKKSDDTAAAPARAIVKRGSGVVDQKIYDSVLKAVMSQRLRPGTKLTEASLCELFAVSRTIVRKAIQRLAHDHILELRPNRGAIIAQPTPQETREIFAARRAIEAAIVPLAVEHATRTQISRLRQIVKEEHASFHSGDHAKWIRLGGEFHILLSESAGNPVLTRFLRELVSRCSLIIALYQAPNKTACPNDEHEELINAIATGDAKQAVRLMNQHLIDIERALLLSDDEHEVNLADILDIA
ncbi:bacterial regulatory s, gntR family protein [Collimonas arenae]|uniref:Bacterial regulatory s, gntR family protein n=1 Tax=Collimonas arenae TaxID=279058 RepID=A0A127QDC5_9BURK|nr:GntR family transcriptional regulator [Collimonas arenae]AMO98132.1 bacterial regulatory s, gntR family protein [Collimonas arenae]AMP08001.1 bacterial regulatory s, gntR family protein [Collimonas arenae]